MFCPQCGRPAAPGARFCMHCGAPLVAGAEAAGRPSPTPPCAHCGGASVILCGSCRSHACHAHVRRVQTFHYAYAEASFEERQRRQAERRWHATYPMQGNLPRLPIEDLFDVSWGQATPGAISTVCHVCAKALVAANPPRTNLTYVALLE